MAHHEEFGDFVRKARIAARMSLRHAARTMGFSASFLSRVEAGLEAASPKLAAAIAQTYSVPVEELTRRAADKAPGVYGHTVRNSPELRALYRLGSSLTPEEVEAFLRRVLGERGLSDDDLELELRKLRAELPRLRTGSEGLFAAEVRPRRLSRETITAIANGFLRRHGYGPGRYTPPTPIELMIDCEPDIVLRFDDLDPQPSTEPNVLGMTRWAIDGRKEIIINDALNSYDSAQNEYRLLFTLGHELFHAIEHLPLMTGQPYAYFRTTSETKGHVGQTRAERALAQWRATTAPRRLDTPEDWREWQAQQFSAAVLVPGWALRAELAARDVELPVQHSGDARATALELAGSLEFQGRLFEEPLHQVFCVSRLAMAVRLLSLNIVSGERTM
jgi:transcriptional regulator with XRE-family HTH domain